MGFRTFSRKTVFISCSRDMAGAAAVVRASIERANRHMASGTGWDVYHWEKSDSVWTSESTWQEHIPRPSDPNCGLVICLFGERLGEMLPASFPWPADLALPDWAAWPAKAADRVGVTGTLFEVIDALYGPQPDGTKRQVLCLFKGSAQKLFAKGLDAGAREFGFGQEYTRLCQGKQRPTREDGRAYDDQIDALDLTLRMQFHEGGLPFSCFGMPDTTPEDTLRALDALLERDLPRLLGVRPSDTRRREPKGLFSYAPDDHPIFFGRDAEVERALSRLEDLAKAPDSVPLLLLSGRSGEGKSSVMRAGLGGRMGAGLYADRCGTFAAVDRTVRALLQGDPLLLLAEAVETALGAPLFDGHALGDFVASTRAGKLTTAVARALAARPKIAGHPSRLFLGLDQLDDVVFEAEQDTALADRLCGLFAIVKDLCRKGLAWGALTIPEDVIPRLTTVVPGLDLPVEALRPPGEDDLYHLISRSFAAFRLPPAEVPRIHDEAVDWLRRQEHPGPILPLVSALMAELQRVMAERQKARIGGEPPPEAPLTLASVLDRLGERAWTDVTRGMAVGWDEKLGRLLRQLVVTRIGGGVTRGLRNCPLDHPAVAEAGPLVAELQRHRFLYRPDGHSLRLTHEAIVAGWSRASRWYADEKALQVTLAEIEPKAERWQTDRTAGQPGRVLTDPADLEAAAYLWMQYRDDTDLLPLAFLRASLLPLIDGFRDRGDFLGPDGLSHFRAAVVIDDADLVDGWLAALEVVAEDLRQAVIDHYEPKRAKTPLVSAAGWGSIRVVAWLLDMGVDAKVADGEGWTPLHMGAARGRSEAVALLLERSEIDAKLSDGSIPLHLAAFYGRADVVTLLMYWSAVDARQNEGLTPLHFAAANGHVQVVALLLDRAEVDARTSYGWAPLHFAAANGHTQVVALLLDRAEVDAQDENDGLTPLHIAASGGHTDVVTLLVNYADVEKRSTNGSTALHIAARLGHTDTIEALMLRANVTAVEEHTDWTALQIAVWNGHTDSVRILIRTSKIEQIDNIGWTAFHIAAVRGDTEIMKVLIDDQEIDLNIMDSSGITPFKHAVYGSCTDMVEILLKINAVDRNSETIADALAHAALRGDVTLTKTLLSYADVGSAEAWNPNLITRAVHSGSFAVFALLLDHGARPDFANTDGNDDLAYAIAFGRESMIPALWARHPDPTVAETAARRLLADPEGGVLGYIENSALNLPEDAREALKAAIRAAAPESFDAFCDVLAAATLRLGGDPRYEIARLQALRRHPPAKAEVIARAAVATADQAKPDGSA
jgi:ankyrin repeat protein